MGDSSATAWGSAPFPLCSCRVALAPCLPLVSHPHGAETWFLEAEKELRQQAEEPGLLGFVVGFFYLFIFVLGTCALSTFEIQETKAALRRAIPRV